jgi:hypothetical protein
MGRPPLESKQRQLAVALRPEVRAQLEAAATASGHSVAEEIRRRINFTLWLDSYDKPTRDLADAVMEIAREIERQTRSPWQSNRKSNEALAAAVQEWLEGLRPRLSGGASDLFGPDDPATLGRSIARYHRHVRAEVEKSAEEVPILDEWKKS